MNFLNFFWLNPQKSLRKYFLFCSNSLSLSFLLFFTTACLKTHSQLQKEMDSTLPRVAYTEYSDHYSEGNLHEKKQIQKSKEVSSPSPFPQRNPAHSPPSPSFSEQQQRALIDSRFYGIDRDFRELYGRIETIEQQLSQIQEVFKNEKQGEFKRPEKIQEIKERINTLEKALLAIDQKISSSSGKEPESSPLKKEETVKEEDSKKDLNKKKSEKNISGKKEGKTPVKKNLEKEKPEKNKKTEKKKSEKERKKDSFSQAESFFKKKEYEEAIVRYDKYRKSRPKGKNYPKATFQLGLCFQKLNMNEDAKAFYEELIQRFPKNPLSLKAKKILKNMKKKQN